MRVLEVRNVQQALPVALYTLSKYGVLRESRNGQVFQSPEPVTTVYARPCERVIFWPERDANPFLHLYEAIWMLGGRDDLAPLIQYGKNMANYSDDGVTLHGAYGYRWRHKFGIDQLNIIVDRLKANKDDRRCVLQMWDASFDLHTEDKAKDLPCNDTATFQIGTDGKLDLVVFCRSNDIVWGAYGANAVTFSFLLEYMAARIDVPVGRYSQVSVNWHGYLKTLEPVQHLKEYAFVNNGLLLTDDRKDPYYKDTFLIPMQNDKKLDELDYNIDLDSQIDTLLLQVDQGFTEEFEPWTQWDEMVYDVLHAHHTWKTLEGEERYTKAIAELFNSQSLGCDWNLAATQWLERRYDAWKLKQNTK